MSQDDDCCPACGVAWDDLPIGHDLAVPLNGGAPTCSVVTRPVTPEEFMSSARPPRNPPHGMPPQIVKIEKETTFGTPLSPLPFLALDDADDDAEGADEAD